MSISGLVMPYFNTPSMTMLQERVDPNYLGRVFGIFSMISSSMMPIGMLVFGPIADIVKIEWLLILTGTLMFILGMIFIRNKAFIEAGEPIKKMMLLKKRDRGMALKIIRESCFTIAAIFAGIWFFTEQVMLRQLMMIF